MMALLPAFAQPNRDKWAFKPKDSWPFMYEDFTEGVVCSDSGDDILTSDVEHTLATSRPERILLQTGNLETASREIRSFRNEGYMLRKSIPLYLEPGRGNFELLFLFVPDREGLLGQNPARAHQSRNVQRPKERPQRANMSDIPHFVQKTPSFKQRKD